MNAGELVEGLLEVAKAERMCIVELIRKLATKWEEQAGDVPMRVIGEAFEDCAGELKTYEETVLWSAVYAAVIGSQQQPWNKERQDDACKEADAAVERLRTRLGHDDSKNDDAREMARLKALAKTCDAERVAMERVLSDVKADTLILRYALQDGNAGLATNEQGRDARHALARLTGFDVTFAGLRLDLEMFADNEKAGDE